MPGLYFLVVAGAGFEPASGGYAYHYNFRCFAPENEFAGLDYTFIPVGCLPSSLYTFLLLSRRLGSGLP